MLQIPLLTGVIFENISVKWVLERQTATVGLHLVVKIDESVFWRENTSRLQIFGFFSATELESSRNISFTAEN